MRVQPSVAQINVCREGGAAGGAGAADAAAAATAATTTAAAAAAAGVLAAATAAIACRAGVGASAFKSGGWDVDVDVDVDAASAGESTRNFSPRSSLRVRPSGNADATTSECTQQFVVSFATNQSIGR